MAALQTGLQDGGAVVYVDAFSYPLLVGPEELMVLVPGLVSEAFADGVILRLGDP